MRLKLIYVDGNISRIKSVSTIALKIEIAWNLIRIKKYLPFYYSNFMQSRFSRHSLIWILDITMDMWFDD